MVTSEAELCVGLGHELGKVGSRVGDLGASGRVGQKVGVSVEGSRQGLSSEGMLRGERGQGLSESGLREREQTMTGGDPRH